MAKKRASRLSLVMGEGSGDKSGKPDWAKADTSLICDLIVMLGDMGGAIRFGYTRERASYSVGVYLDDDSATFYCGPEQEIDHFLEMLKSRFASLE